MSSAEAPRGASLAGLRAAKPWIIAGLLAVVAIAVYLRFVSGAPFGLDEWWNGVAGVSRGSTVYAIAVFLAEIGGSLGAAACTAVAVALLLATRRPRDAAAVGAAMLLGVAASETIKAFVMRPRPGNPVYSSHGSSFPSGHSMGAAALAVALALVVAGSEELAQSVQRWAWTLAVLWLFAMMWSRTALHVHWLSDTLAGAALGACAAVSARLLCYRRAER